MNGGELMVEFAVGILAEQVALRAGQLLWNRPEFAPISDRIRGALDTVEFRNLTERAFRIFLNNAEHSLPGLLDEGFVRMSPVQQLLANFIVNGQSVEIDKISELFSKRFRLPHLAPDARAEIERLLQVLRNTFLEHPSYGQLIIGHDITELGIALDKIFQQFTAVNQTVAEAQETVIAHLPTGPRAINKDWFARHIADATATARNSNRYIPQLNVELPIATIFEGMGRTNNFAERLAEQYRSLRSAHYNVSTWGSRVTGLESEYGNLFRVCESIFDLLDRSLVTPANELLPVNELTSKIDEAITLLEGLHDTLQTRFANAKQESPEASNVQETSRIDISRYEVRRLLGELEALRDDIESKEYKLANQPALLMTGHAGIGKTHLLCDVAVERIANTLPTILLFGENFDASEPWGQIIRLLDLSPAYSAEEYLNALNDFAEQNQTRCLIFIDAINETPEHRVWTQHLARMLTKIGQYRSLGIVITIRDEYEQMILPAGLRTENLWTRVEHRGFAGLVPRAVQTYFEHYGLEFRIPPLRQEFHVPLFLRIVCEALKEHGLRSLPSGTSGITQIFQFFLAAINRRIVSVLDLDPSSRLVFDVVDELIKAMIGAGQIFVPKDTAKQLISHLHESATYSQSLYRLLQIEGLLVETTIEAQEVVRFQYDLFVDHQIVRYLLEQSLIDPRVPYLAFEETTDLGVILRNQGAFAFRQGLMSAFAIQIPEQFDVELFEIIPDLYEHDWMFDVILLSIVWRSWSQLRVRQPLVDFLNDTVGRDRNNLQIYFSQLLTIACNPDNPFNAERMHSVLMRWDLSFRDAVWTTFTYYNYDPTESAQSAVARLLEWAESPDYLNKVDPVAVQLLGIGVAWLLTSSNPFLRDRATRALIVIYTDRIQLLTELIQKFDAVNDLYVLERLLAVAYGCSMRTNDLENLNSLAEYIYVSFFRDSAPPPHILLRDYARGVIERAYKHNPDLAIPMDKVRPPYRSEPISEPLSEEDINRLYGQLPERANYEERGKYQIFASVMHGDFGRYVIANRVHDWSYIPITDNHPKFQKQLMTEFMNSLSPDQLEVWNEIQKRQSQFSISNYLSTLEGLNGSLGEDSDDAGEGDMEADQSEEVKLKELNASFMSSLTPTQASLYKEMDDAGNRYDYELPFDNAKRWIVQRVFELGWKGYELGRFDSIIDSQRMSERYWTERIGKKYQWIALYEYLARLSDNYHFIGEEDEEGNLASYNGPWTSHLRDIDPSVILTRSYADSSSQSWWFPVRYDQWQPRETLEAWIADKADLPSIRDIEQMLLVSSPNGNSWVSFGGMYDWNEPIPPRQHRDEKPRRTIWYRLDAYLVRRADTDAFLEWAQKQNYMNNWMPQSLEARTEFYGEHGWAASDQYHRRFYENWPWVTEDRFEKHGMPCSVIVPTEYIGNEIERDQNNSFRGLIPSAWLIENIPLQWRGIEGQFTDAYGKVICIEPSIHEPGPQTLLIERNAFTAFLDENQFALVWTLLGEKLVYSNNPRGVGRLTINGAFLLEKGTLRGGLTTDYDSPHTDEDEDLDEPPPVP
jgi:hypothetical protein